MHLQKYMNNSDIKGYRNTYENKYPAFLSMDVPLDAVLCATNACPSLDVQTCFISESTFIIIVNICRKCMMKY